MQLSLHSSCQSDDLFSLLVGYKCSLSCIQRDKMNLPSLTVLKESIPPSGSKPPLIKECLGCP
jgi:hypothetical protein